MSTQIFVNLPVKDLDKSMAFFKAVGYSFNPDFTNDQGACMIVADDIYFMLLVEPFFQSFTPKTLADAKRSTEAIMCLSLDSRAQVDELVDKAIAAGAKASKDSDGPDFMYSRGFEDLDGHLWEIIHMDSGASAHA